MHVHEGADGNLYLWNAPETPGSRQDHSDGVTYKRNNRDIHRDRLYSVSRNSLPRSQRNLSVADLLNVWENRTPSKFLRVRPFPLFLLVCLIGVLIAFPDFVNTIFHGLATPFGFLIAAPLAYLAFGRRTPDFLDFGLLKRVDVREVNLNFSDILKDRDRIVNSRVWKAGLLDAGTLGWNPDDMIGQMIDQAIEYNSLREVQRSLPSTGQKASDVIAAVAEDAQSKATVMKEAADHAGVLSARLRENEEVDAVRDLIVRAQLAVQPLPAPDRNVPFEALAYGIDRMASDRETEN